MTLSNQAALEWSRFVMDSKLLGWTVGKQGERLLATHDRASLVWPVPRSETQRQQVLQILRQVPPQSAEEERERKRYAERKAELDALEAARLVVLVTR